VSAASYTQRRQRYERAATQDSLEQVNTSSDNEGSTFIERTFDYG